LPVHAKYSAHEEVSYEGNDCILKEWWHQLKVNAPKKKTMGKDNLIVWGLWAGIVFESPVHRTEKDL
jgi:hypothetical protein